MPFLCASVRRAPLYQALSTRLVPYIARMTAAPPFFCTTRAQSTFGWNSETSGTCSIAAIVGRCAPASQALRERIRREAR
jgi:hypothetical protein